MGAVSSGSLRDVMNQTGSLDKRVARFIQHIVFSACVGVHTLQLWQRESVLLDRLADLQWSAAPGKQDICIGDILDRVGHC